MSFNFKSIVAAGIVGLSLAGCVETTGGTVVRDGLNRNVTIVNRTGRTIYRFYGSNVGTSSWQEDILGSSVLANNSSVNVNFDDGTGHCNFDFKIVFPDGSYVEDYNINVCVIGTYTVR